MLTALKQFLSNRPTVEGLNSHRKGRVEERTFSVASADVPEQAIRFGLLDEIRIHLVPVLLGEGKRLFDHMGHQRIHLEHTRMVEVPDT